MSIRGGKQSGVTLIELCVSIVVIAIAAGAVLGVLTRSVGRSADAMIMSQAVSVAEAYLEEITLKPFADPDGVALLVKWIASMPPEATPTTVENTK